jgi:hypothetical protein
MKRFCSLIAILAFAISTMAADFSIQPAAGMPTFSTTYNGQMVSDVIDVSALTPGDLVTYEIYLENIEFNLAGWEFRIQFPADRLCLSETVADWNAPSTSLAVFTPGPLLAMDHQGLPADVNGDITIETLDNGSAEIRIGGVWEVAASRPMGSPGTPNAGGLLGTIAFEYNCPGVSPDCYSQIESVRCFLTENETVGSDIFADDSATRVAVVSGPQVDAIGYTGVAGYFGSSTFSDGGGSVVKWADGNGDGVLNALDSLTNVICSIFSGMDPGCVDGGATPWLSNNADDYRRTFDSNCDGSVNAVDALRNLQGSLLLSARDNFKRAEYRKLSADRGVMNIQPSGARAAMSHVQIALRGVQAYNVRISPADQERGWLLASKTNGEVLGYTLVNVVNPEMIEVPVVSFDYQRTNAKGSVAILETLHMKYDQSIVNFTPSLMEVGAETNK